MSGFNRAVLKRITVHIVCWLYQIKESRMYERVGIYICTMFWLKKLTEGDHRKVLIVDGVLMLQRALSEIGWEDVNWVYLL
jgi:hypothetical protein